MRESRVSVLMVCGLRFFSPAPKRVAFSGLKFFFCGRLFSPLVFWMQLYGLQICSDAMWTGVSTSKINYKCQMKNAQYHLSCITYHSPLLQRLKFFYQDC